MYRGLFVALLLAFLWCTLAAPASAQTGSHCPICHTPTFLGNITAGNAYNCNVNGVGHDAAQCGWGPLMARMQYYTFGNDTSTWADAATIIASLETAYSVANPTGSFPSGTAGVLYTPVTMTGVTTLGAIENPPGTIPGGVAPFTFAATSGLPSGMALSSAGVLSGTPASQGTYTVQITIRDAAATPIVVTTRSLFIAPPVAPLSITGPASLSPGNLGVSYGPVTFTASGGTGTGYTWSATGLPGGMSINPSTGALGGIPNASGPFNPQFTVKDSSNATTSVVRSLTIVPPPLSLIGPMTLLVGTLGVSYGPLSFLGNGGAGGYTYSAIGLPSGMSINPSSGQLGGIPTVFGSFNPQFTVKDSNNATSSLTLPLTINQVATSSPFSAGGQAFSASGGSGSLTLTFPPGFAWTATTNAPWIVFTGSASGVGSGTLSYTVVANFGASDRSSAITIAGYSFTVEQQAIAITGMNFIGSMSQVNAEENWITSFTLVNKGTTTATTRMSLFGDAIDATGNGPLTLPLAFPQQTGSPGPLLAASFDRTLPANASLVIATAGPQSGTVLVGSAQLAATGTVDGFAIFHHYLTQQEAVVPLETRNASSYRMAFDNRNQIELGVAVQNVSAQAANIPVVIRDDTGTIISTGSSISLPGNGHTSFTLSKQYPVTVNLLGSIEFDTPAGGQISVLGQRFTPPNNALTTMPALANVGTTGGSFAEIASAGDGWQSTFVLLNVGTSAAQATLNFFADTTGLPLFPQLSFPQSGGGPMIVDSTVTRLLPAGGMLLVQTSGGGPLLIGSAQLITAGQVSGFVIYRHNNQEAVVPLESRNSNAYILAFDNTNSTATGVAVNAVSTQNVNIPVIVRDDTGTTIATDMLTLAPNGHIQFTLVTDKYPGTANIRGTIEFDKPANGQIGVVGLRIPPTQTYTSLPPLASQPH